MVMIEFETNFFLLLNQIGSGLHGAKRLENGGRSALKAR